jgi:hypothetical protein
VSVFVVCTKEEWEDMSLEIDQTLTAYRNFILDDQCVFNVFVMPVGRFAFLSVIMKNL